MTQLSITLDEYKTSIHTMMTVALGQNSYASEAAAEVVLSINNAPHWKLDLGKLHHLDDERFNAALQCIFGKRKFIIEPEQLIKNSMPLFTKIKVKHKHLKTI